MRSSTHATGGFVRRRQKEPAELFNEFASGSCGAAAAFGRRILARRRRPGGAAAPQVRREAPNCSPFRILRSFMLTNSEAVRNPRHPESAKRDEGSQNAKSLQFRDPSPSNAAQDDGFFSQPLITMTKSLYICYFGLREPLVQTQVLPYLRELAKSGVAIFLLTFEPERWDDAQMREQLRVDGIEWFASKYHKRPTVPATLFDVLAGALRAIRIVRRNGIGIIHARSHVPALMGAIAKRFTRAKLLFDVRGLMADEYVESGNWRAGGWLFRLAKRVERFLLRNSDAFVVLTEKVRAELFASEAKPLEVIPCCIDPARFASAERERMHERIVIVYVGALGNTYLPREMAEFFAAAKAADARVFPLILTQSRPEIIREHLAACGFQPSDYQIGFATAAELPSYLDRKSVV